MKYHKGTIPPIGSFFVHTPKYELDDIFVVINHNETNNCQSITEKRLYHCSYDTDMWLLSQEEVDNLKVNLL